MPKDHPIQELKKNYNQLKIKHSLPEFTELNKLFDIEDTEIETEFLLKKVRRTISEKIASYLRFIDIILNPSNAPIFFFKLVKRLDSKDMQTLKNIYEKLGKFEIQTICLDIDYSEKNDAEFIKDIFNTFNKEIKKDFIVIIEKLNTEEENSKKINGSYFG